MSDHNERACANCGSLLHHEDVCPRELSTATRGSEPPAGAAKRPKLTMQEARELSADIARRAEERRKAAVALECTPPPQQPGGTPEVDAAVWVAERDPQTGEGIRVVSESVAVTLERQRNEARAALAAAKAEVEAAREAYTSTQQSTLARLNAIARAFGWQPQTKNEDPELDDLRAELEQTRRDVEVKRAGLTALAADYDKLAARLTAAEQRADGAEKERAKLGDVLEKWFPDITSPHAFPIERAIYLLRLHKLAKGDIAALTAQRDTAIRERDEAKAEVEELKEAREATAGRHGGEILRLNTNHSHRIAALGAALDAFERTERGIPQAHMAAKLVAELRAALAAKTPEGGV